MSDTLIHPGGAVFSPCRLYRYRLSRRWGAGPVAAFLMLNPSTADETQDDPTIRRCIAFAKREGCGGLEVVNIFAFRATDPKDMRAATDPVGPDNDAALLAAAAEIDGPLVCAWGNHGAHMGRSAAVRKLLAPYAPLRLAITGKGEPKHPLYIRGDAPLVPLEAA